MVLCRACVEVATSSGPEPPTTTGGGTGNPPATSSPTPSVATTSSTTPERVRVNPTNAIQLLLDRHEEFRRKRENETPSTIQQPQQRQRTERVERQMVTHSSAEEARSHMRQNGGRQRGRENIKFDGLVCVVGDAVYRNTRRGSQPVTEVWLLGKSVIESANAEQQNHVLDMVHEEYIDSFGRAVPDAAPAESILNHIIIASVWGDRPRDRPLAAGDLISVHSNSNYTQYRWKTQMSINWDSLSYI